MLLGNPVPQLRLGTSTSTILLFSSHSPDRHTLQLFVHGPSDIEFPRVLSVLSPPVSCLQILAGRCVVSIMNGNNIASYTHTFPFLAILSMPSLRCVVISTSDKVNKPWLIWVFWFKFLHFISIVWANSLTTWSCPNLYLPYLREICYDDETCTKFGGLWQSGHIESSVIPQILRFVGVCSKLYTALSTDYSWKNLYFLISLSRSIAVPYICSLSHMVQFSWLLVSFAWMYFASSSCCFISS